MNTKWITPKDRQEWLSLRVGDVTSSEVAALFGKHPYLSYFELWHNKKNGIIETDKKLSEYVEIGSLVEPYIAGLVSRKYFNGVEHRKIDDYACIPELRIGASFDHLMLLDPEEHAEIKNLDRWVYANQWIDGEAPPHIELQVQVQLMVGGFSANNICPFVGGNSLPSPIRREPVPEIQKAIIAKVAEFWRTIENNEEPDPDFDSDARAVIDLYGYAEPGSTMTDPPEVVAKQARRYKRLGKLKSQIEKEMSKSKAIILSEIGDAERVRGDGFKISAGMVGPKQINYERSGYRDFRIFLKGEGK